MKPKQKTHPILIGLVLLITGINNNLNAQVFTGFSAFKSIIEYEGQRFLMDEIYEIATSEFDKMKVDKTITEIDSDEGFMFVLTSYSFNGEKGVVITSFNSTSFQNNKYQFTNIHLTHEEFTDLYNEFLSLANNYITPYEHFLKKFNDRLILDVNKEASDIYYTLWVDTYSRHTFTPPKWERAFKRYNKFIEN